MTRLTEFLPFEVWYEVSTGFGRFYALLTTLAVRVAVAHPGLRRPIYRSKKKNDRLDAHKLAKLLQVVEVTKVYVPAADICTWRKLITFRKRLIEKRPRAKNGIRCPLRSLGINLPTEFGLWTNRRIAWLKSLEFNQSRHALKRSVLLEELETHSKHIRLVEQERLVSSKDSPGVQLLQTISGVALRSAESVVAFIDNPHRFPNSKRLGSYFGLMPSQDQSGGTNRMHHITKEGCPVMRAMLTEAVWQTVRRSPTVKSFQQRVPRGKPNRRRISMIATSHYLVRVMWSMLKNGVV